MATNLLLTSKKLMKGLNAAGYKLTFATRQFIGRDERTKTMFIVSKAVWDEEKGKYYNEELFASTSLVRIVMFLRDMWYLHQGLELPTDQEVWNRVREEIMEDGKYGQGAISKE